MGRSNISARARKLDSRIEKLSERIDDCDGSIFALKEATREVRACRKYLTAKGDADVAIEAMKNMIFDLQEQMKELRPELRQAEREWYRLPKTDLGRVSGA